MMGRAASAKKQAAHDAAQAALNKRETTEPGAAGRWGVRRLNFPISGEG